MNDSPHNHQRQSESSDYSPDRGFDGDRSKKILNFKETLLNYDKIKRLFT